MSAQLQSRPRVGVEWLSSADWWHLAAREKTETLWTQGVLGSVIW